MPTRNIGSISSADLAHHPLGLVTILLCIDERRINRLVAKDRSRSLQPEPLSDPRRGIVAELVGKPHGDPEALASPPDHVPIGAFPVAFPGHDHLPVDP